MEKMIDCLFIGHNEMEFTGYEKTVRQMGTESGAYRDLNLNYIQYNHKLLTVGDAFNEFCYNHSALDNSIGPYSLGNLFSLTIAYLGSYLYRRGFSFDYVNSFQDEKDELARILKGGNIRAIVIPTTLYVTSFPLLEIISFIKKYNNTAKIIIGGPFVATQMRAISDNMLLEFLFKTLNADFYVNNSQGELALANILHALKNKLSYDGIDNIIYKSGSKYIFNQTSPENNKLEENPIEWGLFADKIGQYAAIRTSISCPFSCSFCGFPQHAGKYQTTVVDCIERELDALAKLGKIKSVNIIDDTFNVPPERFKDIMRMMIRKNYDFHWNCNFRCQFSDKEMVDLMRESGCQGVLLGIESASDQMLKNMNKAVTVDKYKTGLSLLNEGGITTYGSFFIGFPGETYETVEETVNFIKEYKPTFFRTQLWYCEPITPIFKEKEKYNIVGSQFKWSHATMDSKTACDIVDKLFMSITESVWVPQYNFEFYSIFNLLNRGMSVEQLKKFLSAFNQGIRERMLDQKNGEISPKVIKALQSVFDEEAPTDGTTGGMLPGDNAVERYNADFVF